MLKSIFVQLAVAALCALFVAAAPVPDAAADTAAAGASKKKPQDPFTLFFWVKKKPGLSYDEFYKYWEFTHGPKVVKYALKHGFLGYTQVHTSPEVKATWNATTIPYDGYVEFDLLSAKQFQEASNDPYFPEIIYPDELNFLQLDSNGFAPQQNGGVSTFGVRKVFVANGKAVHRK